MPTRFLRRAAPVRRCRVVVVRGTVTTGHGALPRLPSAAKCLPVDWQGEHQEDGDNRASDGHAETQHWNLLSSNRPDRVNRQAALYHLFH